MQSWHPSVEHHQAQPYWCFLVGAASMSSLYSTARELVSTYIFISFPSNTTLLGQVCSVTLWQWLLLAFVLEEYALSSQPCRTLMAHCLIKLLLRKTTNIQESAPQVFHRGKKHSFVWWSGECLPKHFLNTITNSHVPCRLQAPILRHHFADCVFTHQLKSSLSDMNCIIRVAMLGGPNCSLGYSRG